MQELKESIAKLEWRVDGHEGEIKVLKDTSKELTKTLNDITQTLKQIKWIAVGAGAMFFADQFGISALFKLLAI